MISSSNSTLDFLEAARLHAIGESIRHIKARRYDKFGCAVQASAIYARMIKRIRGETQPLRVGPRTGVVPMEVRA